MQSFSIVLVHKGASAYSIVRPLNPSEIEIYASSVLQDHLRQISGVLIPIIDDSNAESDFEILVGNTNRSGLIVELTSIDSYSIQTKDRKLVIMGIGKGTLYGVYTFLERYLDCRKYSSKVKFIPKKESISITEINVLEIPDIKFRSLHYYDAETDQEYLDWHKLHRIDDRWGLWGHSFFKLLSPQEYFTVHPEYFGLVNGQRKAMQLCLTNPDVFRILVENLSKKMKEFPQLDNWSVSQNDDLGACECTNCSLLNSKYESPQGSILTFVNKVAEVFPDKTISTLAYTYSRKAPKGLYPLRNVNILFSSIDINRAKPVVTDPRSEAFRNDFDAWKGLTSNMIIWDYVVQFSNYFSPFPNLNTLKPNFNYFSGNKPEGFFIQGSVEVPGELAELRTYILAKLLWDKDTDVDALKTEFLNAYYGKAGASVNEYLNQIHSNAEKSWKRMDIYDNPIIPFQTYLSNQFLTEYLSILDNGALLVKDDVDMFKRIQLLKLPLNFAMLQQARFHGIDQNGVFILEDKKWTVRNNVKSNLQDLVKMLGNNGISQLNEEGLTPEQYMEEWEAVFESGPEIHKALNKPLRFLTPNNEEFISKGPRTLVDGNTGTRDFNYNWVGWYGENMEVLIDMLSPTKMEQVKISFLENHRFYMFLPSVIRVEVSNDGIKYREVARFNNPGPLEALPKSIRKFVLDFDKIEARYVKVVAINLSELPVWRNRIDRKPWLLTDEIIVN
ncbi:F5/8 type C domain-containing protein [Daejeonella rubra]|uniref:F5/8 type C domain-containing protein n=1 Tax=Daejeonella rubra TaxID=990371 RepID=A0A1G9UXU1_9SPHI|nr:DUF4838 domain-containing protein [Daejeonella rubra]SDM64784.1 F5/8 type C domain-containing protein [Daejeonella rubra]